MSAPMKNLLISLTCPLLMLAYIMTGNNGLYALLALMLWIMFLVMILVMACTPYVKDKMSSLQKATMRAKMRNYTANRYIGYCLSAFLLISLFWYGKVVTGSAYFLTIIMVHGIRAYYLKEDDANDE